MAGDGVWTDDFRDRSFHRRAAGGAQRPAQCRRLAQAALEQIAEQGVLAVAVEPLARRLGVTKGSFYWIFPSREALLVAALERGRRSSRKKCSAS